MRTYIDIVTAKTVLSEAVKVDIEKTDSGNQTTQETVTFNDEKTLRDLALDIAMFCDWNDRGEVYVRLPNGKTLNFHEQEYKDFNGSSSYADWIVMHIKQALGAK